MTGLLFNVVDALAIEVGCREETWTIVTELAEKERAPGTRGCSVFEVFGVPIEAMLNCLVKEARTS